MVGGVCLRAHPAPDRVPDVLFGLKTGGTAWDGLPADLIGHDVDATMDPNPPGAREN